MKGTFLLPKSTPPSLRPKSSLQTPRQTSLQTPLQTPLISTRYSSLVNVSRVSFPACVSVITRLRDTRPFILNCSYIEEDADVLLKRRTDALRVSDLFGRLVCDSLLRTLLAFDLSKSVDSSSTQNATVLFSYHLLLPSSLPRFSCHSRHKKLFSTSSSNLLVSRHFTTLRVS